MLTPKSSHLVERAAERLLRSGGLNNPETQLLYSPADAAVADPPVRDTPLSAPAQKVEPATPAQRSSLFSRPRPPAAPPQPATAQPRSTARDPVPLTPDPLAPVPLAPVPLAPVPLAPVPLAPVPLAPVPLASVPLAPVPLAPVPLAPVPLASVPLAPVPLADPASTRPEASPTIAAAALQRAGMIDWSRSRTRISEEFRLVQRQILRAAFGPDAQPGFSNLLLVTSARPGEGKSFIAANLSASIARQADHPVLLIDADAKRESICSSLGLADAPGLLDLAANPRLDPAPMIARTPIELLSILPIGRERERSAELFSATEMARLIENLGRRYADRLLILDAPPCLSTSDPALLAQLVGQILFVVEADRTQREEIEAALDLVQACPTITMVLNKQQTSTRHSFGAYSSYYAA
ncbi:P-loop NTPase [Rhodopila sp.]|uniref:P-loop NTPase n=1 Tax=Rhodopila sp. TaxID=2480087 RepID=UPI003D0C4416